MTTADPLAAKMEDLRRRAALADQWLTDWWSLFGTEPFCRVAGELRQAEEELRKLTAEHPESADRRC